MEVFFSQTLYCLRREKELDPSLSTWRFANPCYLFAVEYKKPVRVQHREREILSHFFAALNQLKMTESF